MKLPRRARLAIVFVLLLACGTVSVAVKLEQLQKDADFYKKQGEARMAKGNYREVARNFVTAISLDPRNADLYVLFGDALHGFRDLDANLGEKPRAAWLRALSIDPHNEAALRRLLTDAQERAAAQQSMEALAELRQYAASLLAVAPNDPAAQQWSHICAILQDLALSKEGSDFETHYQAIRSLIRANRSNADLPFCLAMVELERARRLRGQERFDAADLHLQTAADQFSSIRAGPAHVDLYLRASAVASIIGKLDGPRTARWLFPSLHQSAFVAAMTEATPARAHEIVMAAVTAAQALQDLDSAETICRRQIAMNPSDIESRLILARVIAADPTRSAEALEAMHLPPELEDADVQSPDRVKLMLMRVSLRCKLAEASSGTTREIHLSGADADYRRAAVVSAATPDLLVAHAQLLLAHGDCSGALAELNRITSDDSSEAEDVACLRARALWMQSNRTAAMALLQQAVRRSPTGPARLQLIGYFLELGLVEQAIDHIDAMEEIGACESRRAQQNPDLPVPRAANLALSGIADVLRQSLAADPTNVAVRLKLVESLGMIRPLPRNEIDRLLDDAETTSALSDSADWFHAHAILFLSENRPREARAMIEKALARAPGNPKLEQTRLLIEASELARAPRADDNGRNSIESALCKLATLPETAQRRAILKARAIFCGSFCPRVAPQTLQALRAHLAAVPDDSDALYLLARLLSSSDSPEAVLYTEAAYTHMRRLRSFDADVVDLHAWNLVCHSNTKLGIRLLQGLVDDSESTTLRYRLHYAAAVIFRGEWSGYVHEWRAQVSGRDVQIAADRQK